MEQHYNIGYQLCKLTRCCDSGHGHIHVKQEELDIKCPIKVMDLLRHISTESAKYNPKLIRAFDKEEGKMTV